MILISSTFPETNGISFRDLGTFWLRTRCLIGCNNIQDILATWQKNMATQDSSPLAPPAANSFTTVLFSVGDWIKTSVASLNAISLHPSPVTPLSGVYHNRTFHTHNQMFYHCVTNMIVLSLCN